MKWKPSLVLFSLSICSLGLLSCEQKNEGAQKKEHVSKRFHKQSDVEVREQDGLSYLKGEKSPFTGVVISRDKNWQMKYFANYEQGKLHGVEMRWFEGAGLKKMLDYERGEKVRHREWFENGNRKIDAMMKKGEAFGRHTKWYENGSLRFSGNFIENLLWDGPVKDINENGEVLWDAVFKRGRYVSGIYPAGERQKLIDGGMLEKDDKPLIDTGKRE